MENEYKEKQASTLFDAMQKIESMASLENFAEVVIAPLAKTMDEKLKTWLRDAYTSRMQVLKNPGDPLEGLNAEGKKWVKENCEEK